MTRIWEARLIGDQELLERLAGGRLPSTLQVVLDRGDYYLRLLELPFADSTLVLNHARRTVQMLNGATRVRLGFDPAFQITGLRRVEPDRPATQFTFAEGIPSATRSGIATVVAADSTTSPSTLPEPFEHLLAMAFVEDVSSAALRFWSLPRSWDNLCKIFETIQGDVGGLMHTNGWITKTSAEHLTGTANSFRAVGDAARHQNRSRAFEPPSDPMTLEKATGLIERLLTQWLDSKIWL